MDSWDYYPKLNPRMGQAGKNHRGHLTPLPCSRKSVNLGNVLLPGSVPIPGGIPKPSGCGTWGQRSVLASGVLGMVGLDLTGIFPTLVIP